MSLQKTAGDLSLMMLVQPMRVPLELDVSAIGKMEFVPEVQSLLN